MPKANPQVTVPMLLHSATDQSPLHSILNHARSDKKVQLTLRRLNSVQLVE